MPKKQTHFSDKEQRATNWQKIIKTKVGILELARQLGNVSQAYRVMGCSRDSFRRFKTLRDTGGEAALREIGRQKPNAKNRVDPAVEQAALDFARERSAYGQLRVSNELRKRGAFVSPGGVRSIWPQRDLATFKGRLKALEARMAQEGIVLTESQLAAMECAREEKEARGETETERPGYLGAQDTYYVGNIKGVGRIYRQTFIDTYSKVAFCKLYDRKNALVAADVLNSQAIPFFDSRGVPLLRILTGRGRMEKPFAHGGDTSPVRAQDAILGQTSDEWHCYISNRKLTAEELLRCVRLERATKSTHWLLGVHFGEDFCCAEDENAQQALNVARKIALNCIKTRKQKNGSKLPLSRIIFGCLLDCAKLVDVLRSAGN